MGPDRNMALGFVPPRSRVGDWVRTEYIDLRDRRDAGIGYNLLNRPQSCFDAFHLSAMLRRAFSGLLGNQSTHFLFVLKPPPEPDPNHRKDRDAEDRHDQQRFLVGDDFDHAVMHISLLHNTRDRVSFARMS